MKKPQRIFEARIRENDWRYAIYEQVAVLYSYPINDGKDTFRYTERKWIIVDVVVGQSRAEQRIAELSKQ